MVTTKKKTKKVSPKAKPVVKTATKKAAKKKVLKTSTKKKPGNKSTRIKVSLDQRHSMICDAAYYISLEHTYETVNPSEDWYLAETAIDKICIVNNQY